AALGCSVPLQLLQNARLKLRAESRQRAKLMGARGLGEILQGTDAKLVVDQLDTLWPKPRHCHERCQVRREARRHLLQRGEFTCLDDLLDLAREIPPDTGELGEVLPLLHHFGYAHGQVLDGLCGPPVGPYAEDVRPLDLEQISEAVEQLGNLCVVNGHGAALSQSIDGKRARL